MASNEALYLSRSVLNEQVAEFNAALTILDDFVFILHQDITCEIGSGDTNLMTEMKIDSKLHPNLVRNFNQYSKAERERHNAVHSLMTSARRQFRELLDKFSNVWPKITRMATLFVASNFSATLPNTTIPGRSIQQETSPPNVPMYEKASPPQSLSEENNDAGILSTDLLLRESDVGFGPVVPGRTLDKSRYQVMKDVRKKNASKNISQFQTLKSFLLALQTKNKEIDESRVKIKFANFVATPYSWNGDINDLGAKVFEYMESVKVDRAVDVKAKAKDVIECLGTSFDDIAAGGTYPAGVKDAKLARCARLVYNVISSRDVATFNARQS